MLRGPKSNEEATESPDEESGEFTNFSSFLLGIFGIEIVDDDLNATSGSPTVDCSMAAREKPTWEDTETKLPTRSDSQSNFLHKSSELTNETPITSSLVTEMICEELGVDDAEYVMI